MWLVSLGHDVPGDATDTDLRRWFEDRDEYPEPPNQGQRELAARLGVDLRGAATLYEVGRKLYQVLLIRAWVYSVRRHLLGAPATRHGEIGLADATALAIAQEMSAAWWFQAVDQMATGAADRDDVWFEMSSQAQSSSAFRHVEAALSRLAPPTAQKRAEEPSPVKGGGCFGLAMLVLVVGAGSVAWWLV
ncbi:MAG TPA: hypothetical protein VH092_34270 [Urbifossiella sp.]|nr:hypothetical protein [Urbifossiella sp.]